MKIPEDDGILNWIASTLALMLTVCVLCLYILHEKRMYADRNMKLALENDSLRSINTYLNIELGKARQQLQHTEKEPPIAQISTLNK